MFYDNETFLYGNSENMDLASKGSHLILKNTCKIWEHDCKICETSFTICTVGHMYSIVRMKIGQKPLVVMTI